MRPRIHRSEIAGSSFRIAVAVLCVLLLAPGNYIAVASIVYAMPRIGG